MDKQTRLALLTYESLDNVSSGEIQRAETAARVTLEGEEFSSRGQLAEGRMSLAEAGVYLCPAPHADEFFAQFLKRKRLELTEKYQHLVTRQMLRDSRWLTYTVALLRDAVEEEAQKRQEIYVESLTALPSFSCRHLQLQMISARGTEGTFIHVEETEREVRFRVVVFQEVQEREAILESESLHRLNAARATAERLAAEADARGCVEAAEWNARWLVEREEEKTFEPIPRLAAPNAHRIFEISLWRVMTAESEARQKLEFEEQRLLYPHANLKRSAWDDEEEEEDGNHCGEHDEVETGRTPLTLADFVTRHERLCSSLEREQRERRQDRTEAQHLVAAAFHVNHPVGRDKYADHDDEKIAAVVELHRKRRTTAETSENREEVVVGSNATPALFSVEEGLPPSLEVVPIDRRPQLRQGDDDEEPLILYGYTFTQVPAVRRAGQEPEFVAPGITATESSSSPLPDEPRSLAIYRGDKALPFGSSVEGSCCGVSPECGSNEAAGVEHRVATRPGDEGEGAVGTIRTADGSDDDEWPVDENWSRDAALAKKLEIERLWAALNDVSVPPAL